MKELTLNEISLLEEMKSNCLKKGQYIDEKAKDKFNMLCHLEDFGIAYYELLDVIKEVREFIEWHYEDNKKFYKNKGIGLNYPECDYILEILDKENGNV